MMRRVPLHPLLVAAFPVLFLWSNNTGEVTPADALPALWLVLGVTVVVWVLAAAAYRDVRRGALLASALAFLALSYGHVWGSAPPVGGLAVWFVLAVAVGWLVARLDAGLDAGTSAVNVIALALVVSMTVPIAIDEMESGPSFTADSGDMTGVEGPSRDIYYIILDRYPRQDSAREVFGYDDSPFYDRLRELGFDVAEHSLANYPKTAHSLAASLNMTYLDELAAMEPEGDDWQPVYGMLRNHRVGRDLTEAGYEYIHVGTWWSPTSTAASADVTLRYDLTSEFASVFETTTILPAVKSVLGIEEPELDRRTKLRNYTRWQFDRLDRLAVQPHDQPRFVFAHLTIPHEPYVFEADGSFVTAQTERSRTRTENFVPQLEYANRRTLDFLETLLAGPDERDPLVLLQSDEGPHPEERVRQGPPYRWDLAPLAELREKLRILNAYYLPGGPDVPDDITPVNSFRLVFDTYFGTDLGLLPDQVYIFPDESHLYTFIEVTDRVRVK